MTCRWPRRWRERSARRRGFSLLEMMVVVAILGIIAALAVPNLLPAVRIEALRAAGHALGGFATQARLAAMVERRCVRLRIASATNPAIVVAERLNSFDCENPSAPLIVDTQPLWIEFARQIQDVPALTIEFAPDSAETPGEVRFRPSGRVFSADETLNDDDVVLVIAHPSLDAPNDVRVLIDAAGPICTLKLGERPPGFANTLACP